ncbi:MAG: hypothetical protein H6Q75_1212 [Firmicutes bacterium]|nr:hypothetical protein [Bacillota bacterium]
MDKFDLYEDLKQLSLKTSSANSRDTFVFDAASDPQTILKGLLELAEKQLPGVDSTLLHSFISLAFKTGRLEGFTAGVESHINDEPAIILYPGKETDYHNLGDAILDAVQQYAPSCLVGTNIIIDGKAVPNVGTSTSEEKN